MIRGVIGLFVFALALCAYIVIRPTAPTPQFPQAAAADVSRGVTDNPLSLGGADLADVAALGVIGSAPQGDLTQAPTPQQETPPAFAVDDTARIDETASSILAGLGLEVATPEAPTDPLAEMTGTALADIVAVTGGSLPTATPKVDTALEELVTAALREGRPDFEIDRLVNDAATAGSLAVPGILVTSDGRVDTAVLLESIITQAKIASGEAAPEIPDVPAGDGTGVEVRVVQRATQTEQYRFYTVNQGDSLGAIAVKFYGRVDLYPLIYQANKNILSSPDRIRVGQRLAIPEAPEA